MKILHTASSYYPVVDGVSQVMQQLSEGMVKLGHQVTVVTGFIPYRKKTQINGVEIRQFKIKGNEVVGMNGEVKKYQDYVLKNEFDIILNFACQQWTVDAFWPIIDKVKAKKILVPCGFSAFYWPEYQPYFKKMPDYLRKYDWLLFSSDNYRDINFCRQHQIKNFSVIPNGASVNEFLKTKRGKFKKKYKLNDKFMILTVSSHSKLKGHLDCIKAFAKAKIKNSVLVIIGSFSKRHGCLLKCLWEAKKNNLWSKNKILVFDVSRKEVVWTFLDADLFIFASNVECSPLVLFEAMASRTAFLTTPAGNAKEIIDWSRGGLLIKSKKVNGLVYADIDDFVSKIKKLYTDNHLRNKLAENGFKTWQKRFTWQKIIKDHEKLYLSLIKK